MNHTTNYQLSQWSRTDQVRMEDFNADNAKLDAALKAEADARTALAAEVAKCGNITVGIFTYTGNGTYGSSNPTRITFPQMPAFYIIAGPAMMIGRGGIGSATVVYEYSSYTHISSKGTSWSGNTLSIFDNIDPVKQLNAKVTYTVIGFYVKE